MILGWQSIRLMLLEGDLAWKMNFGGTPILAFVQAKLQLSNPSGKKEEDFIEDATIKTNPLNGRGEFQSKLEKEKNQKQITKYTNHLNLLDKLHKNMNNNFNYQEHGCLRFVVVASRAEYFQEENKFVLEGKDLILYLTAADIEKISPEPKRWKSTWEILSPSSSKEKKKE